MELSKGAGNTGEGPQSNSGASGELHALGFRVRKLAVFLMSAAIDLLFLVLWASVHRLAQFGFDRAGKLTGLDQLTLAVLQGFFTVSTLVIIGVYVVWDVIQAIRGIWRLK